MLNKLNEKKYGLFIVLLRHRQTAKDSQNIKDSTGLRTIIINQTKLINNKGPILLRTGLYQFLLPQTKLRD